jgi:hypothetical protein
LHASGRFAGDQTIAAHVAFAYDAARARVLWNFVRALQDAVLTPDALIVEVPDDSGNGILLVCEYWAAVQTTGINAMVAGGSYNLLKRIPPMVTDQQTGFAPGFAVVQAIERMTRRDTRFAAAAFIEIHFKCELLPGRRHRKGNQMTISRLPPKFAATVRLREPVDRSHSSLLGEQILDQTRWFHLAAHGPKR